MSEVSGPTDRGRMRVSDADREQAADVLREAAGQGRISMDELDERLELAYAAKTYADLAAVTRDLPQDGTALSPSRRRPGAQPHRWDAAEQVLDRDPERSPADGVVGTPPALRGGRGDGRGRA